MRSDRRVELLIALIFGVILAIALVTADSVRAAHEDGRILEFLSDATVYYKHYQERYTGLDALSNWTVFLRASPVLLMILFHGNLLWVQLLNASIMMFSLLVSQRCFERVETKIFYILACLIFPYFSFGFLGLNKEVYALSSAMLFAAYLKSGSLRIFLLSLLLALMARYYMVAPLIMLALTFPKGRAPRFYIPGLALVLISLIGPVAKSFVPQYSYLNLIDGSGKTAYILSFVIDNFGYTFIYPIKYIVLLLVRPFGFLFAGNGDAVGAVVSLLSAAALAVSLSLTLRPLKAPQYVGIFVLAGMLAPIPMMWSEIMHWRYYSFVYIFFLFSICLSMDGVPGISSVGHAPQPREGSGDA